MPPPKEKAGGQAIAGLEASNVSYLFLSQIAVLGFFSFFPAIVSVLSSPLRTYEGLPERVWGKKV